MGYEQPHRIRAPEIRPVRVSAQISAVRLERRLERKHSIPIFSIEGAEVANTAADARKAGTTVAHKDATHTVSANVIVRVLSETECS